MIKKFTKIFLIGLLLASGFSSNITPARAEYSQEYVIDDGIFTNSGSMSATDINNFLISKGSWLANYQIPEYISVPYPLASGGLGYVDARQFNDVTGEALYNKSVAQLIYDEAQAHHVNPRVILVTLQKESTAITRAAPSSQTTAAWPLFYMYNESMEACLKYGTSCNDSAYRTQSINYGGVAQQIAYATAWFGLRYTQYLGANMTITVDGVTFTCQNAATRILYIYTPHIGSWLNFHTIFTSWWEDPTYGPPAPNQPFVMVGLKALPSGSWNIANSKRAISGNFDNTGASDIAIMYDYGLEAMSLFLFNSSSSFNPAAVVSLPRGSWRAESCSNLVKGNFDKNDSIDDIAVLYNYGNESIGLWVFESSNNFKPKLYQFLPSGSWNMGITSEITTDNFDDDDGSDIAALYNYGSSNVGLWVFGSANSYSPNLLFNSGPGSINLSQTKSLVSANLDGSGKKDLALLYDYGSASMGLVVFSSSDGYRPTIMYKTGNNCWNVPSTSNLLAIDIDGADSLSDLAVSYEYSQAAIGIFVFNSAEKYTPTRHYWSGRNNFSTALTIRRIISGDFNNDGKDDLATLYTYGQETMTIFSFNRTADN